MAKNITPLEAWLLDQGLLKGRFAARIGLSLKQLTSAREGRLKSVAVAHAIVKATGGAIDYNALFDPWATRKAAEGDRRSADNLGVAKAKRKATR